MFVVLFWLPGLSLICCLFKFALYNSVVYCSCLPLRCVSGCVICDLFAGVVSAWLLSILIVVCLRYVSVRFVYWCWVCFSAVGCCVCLEFLAGWCLFGLLRLGLVFGSCAFDFYCLYVYCCVITLLFTLVWVCFCWLCLVDLCLC